VSFAHGTNDGQKSIGLIMLTIIGIFPATYGLNPRAAGSLHELSAIMQQAEPLVSRYGDDEKAQALAAIAQLQGEGTGNMSNNLTGPAAKAVKLEVGLRSETAQQRARVRGYVYQVISQLKHVQESHGVSVADKQQAKRIGAQLGSYVEYAPFWVRMLSAICLGVGTMIGYRRIVTTLGERLGNVHLTPAQGASAELIATALIATAGFTGLPVSTTHIVTSGIGGTMVSSGAGLRYSMVYRIIIAWVFTLPMTILIAGGLYYLLASPGV
jgi:PiT family inorganic phosphate transporter